MDDEFIEVRSRGSGRRAKATKTKAALPAQPAKPAHQAPQAKTAPKSASFRLPPIVVKTNAYHQLRADLSSIAGVEFQSIGCYAMPGHKTYLTEKLGLITDSITLAKVGITNPRILNSQETDLMMIDIRKQNITVHTISEALAYTNTKIATNNNELLFIISCPRLRKNILNKIQVYGINNIGKQIHVPHPYYLSHKSQMFIVASLDKEFYNTEDLQEDNTTCIPAIIKGQPASCDFISNPSTQEVITLDRSHLLISSSVWFIFDTTCGIRERNLTGSFIVAYEDCNIFFNNKTISSNTISFPGSPINLPIYGIEVTQQNKVVNLSLEHLHELHKELRSEMKQIHLESHSITWKTWSISSLSRASRDERIQTPKETKRLGSKMTYMLSERQLSIIGNPEVAHICGPGDFLAMQCDGFHLTHDRSHKHLSLVRDHHHLGLFIIYPYPPLVEVLDIFIQTSLKSSLETLQITRGVQNGSVVCI
ncbi:uncharacterized protein LOC128729045 [Anopheles nili]|uniref:uncharacterized protein LOC128729045 n=1 Tax=Anopheles nili TaxID=185578 RepID=UPI00237B2E21|nr:uncharacterized protein LOC128729045 [Anopheles nili]